MTRETRKSVQILSILAVTAIVAYLAIRTYAAQKEKAVTESVFGSIAELGSKLYGAFT